MKKILAIALILLVQTGFAQQYAPIKAQLFKTYAPFTATSDDSTSYVSITSVNPLFASEVILIGVATDSIAADVYIIGRNSALTSCTTTYADSIIGESNTSNVVKIVLKDSGVNRFPAQDQFKVGTVFRASGQGTTTGRTLKWYLWWKF